MKSIRVSAAVAAVVCSSAALWSAEPTTAELQKEVQELKGQVATLQQQQAQNGKDVAKTIDAVLRDAEQRSQLLANGDMGAGYDNGFYIKAGDFKFHPWVQFQFRDVTNYREEAKSGGGSDTENGFETRRLKFGFDGTLWSKDLTYTFIWATNRAASSANTTDSTGASSGKVTLNDGGTPVLEEGWVKYMFADQWGVRLGQFKDPLTHEGLTSSKKLLAAERSYMEDILGLGDNFVQGVSAIYQQDALRAEVAFTDGTKSNNTNFLEPPTNSANWGFAGRVEYKVMGDWKDYDDFTALGTKHDLLVVGGGFDWTQVGNTDVVLHTADIQWENPSGFGVYASYLGRYVSNNDAGSNDLYDWGVLVQGSYLFSSQWEAFARWDYTHFDKDGLSGLENNIHEITGGVNYYLHGHTAKLTIDLTWLPKGAPVGDSGADILPSDDHDEVLLRGQFQLLI